MQYYSSLLLFAKVATFAVCCCYAAKGCCWLLLPVIPSPKDQKLFHSVLKFCCCSENRNAGLASCYYEQFSQTTTLLFFLLCWRKFLFSQCSKGGPHQASSAFLPGRTYYSHVQQHHLQKKAAMPYKREREEGHIRGVQKPQERGDSQ